MNNFSFSSSQKNKDPVSSQQQHQSSALIRYRSAPSSVFATLLNDGNDDYLNSSPESDTMFNLQYSMPMKHETTSELNNGYCNNNSINNGSSVQNLFTGVNSNLIRQSSSPAEFLSYLSSENGFAGMSDVGNLSSNGLEPSVSTSRLGNNISFTTEPSTSRFMPQIVENGNDNIVRGSLENGHMGNTNDTNGFYLPSIPNDSWANSTFNGRNLKMFAISNDTVDTQNEDPKQYTPGLVHHLSLPNTSSEWAKVEKYMRFDQDVPLKTRAKRGCATNPRSIAERVRRTRISNNTKKLLAELFPNMDKHENTADMLDMAVQYIKEIQKEVQTLKEMPVSCTCSSKREKKSSPTS